MKLTLTARALISIAIGASVLIPVGAEAANSGSSADNVETTAGKSAAEFEGQILDLSESWGNATACWVDETGDTTCYRTEKEMDAALEQAGETTDRVSGSEAQGARALSCSSSIRLYRNSYYGGSVLYVSQRHTWITLSWFGWDNSVSSYKVYACSSVFRSGSYGGGSTYWGSTSSWSWRSSMSGWNNVLSSLYIY